MSAKQFLAQKSHHFARRAEIRQIYESCGTLAARAPARRLDEAVYVIFEYLLAAGAWLGVDVLRVDPLCDRGQI